MDKWINHKFKPSTIITEEFKEFAKDFKTHIKNLLPDKLTIHSFNTAHFFLYGFIEKDNKFIYFSIMDVIYHPYSWVDNIIIRTAKDDKDFIGGQNHYIHLSNFAKKVEELL